MASKPTEKTAPEISRTRRRKYHPDAYKFVFASLQYTQERLEKSITDDPDDETAHISGPELLEGIRELGLKQYGLLAATVFRNWGCESTDDFGHIVFELVDRGEMRTTDRDHLSDFFGVYQFEEALERDYVIEAHRAFV